MSTSFDWSPPRGEVPALDRAQLLRDVEMHALRDSQTLQSDGAAVTAAFDEQVERWRDQRHAQLKEARAHEERGIRERIRAADVAAADTEERREAADRAYRSALSRRDHLAAILRGERPGDDGGRWDDRGRMNERRWLSRIVDVALYGSAAVAEVGLNFLAFQLMGASLLETALLAAGVILVTVLLPAQLGVLVATARRTRSLAGWPRAQMIGATAVWIGVLVFVAQVRTAYLFLPPAFGSSVLVTAGLDPGLLTVGWFVVGFAVGLVVLLRSACRHNPYAVAWHAARVQTGRRGRRRSAARETAERAAEQAARERDELAVVGRRYVPQAEEARALAAELQNRYRQALLRRRASVEHCVPVDVDRPALEASSEGGDP